MLSMFKCESCPCNCLRPSFPLLRVNNVHVFRSPTNQGFMPLIKPNSFVLRHLFSQLLLGWLFQVCFSRLKVGVGLKIAPSYIGSIERTTFVDTGPKNFSWSIFSILLIMRVLRMIAVFHMVLEVLVIDLPGLGLLLKAFSCIHLLTVPCHKQSPNRYAIFKII